MKFDEAIAEIKRKVNIADLVGREVKLKQKGRSFLGLCPFHGEKTPSFYVHPDKGYFKCFGCGVAGDVFTYLEKKDNLAFKEIVYQLCEQHNIALEKSRFQQKDLSKLKHERGVVDLFEQVNSFYTNYLKGFRPAKAYLVHERAMPVELLKRIGVGYGGANDHDLFAHFNNNQEQQGSDLISNLKKYGLLADRQNSLFCPYYDRITFPIRNVLGKIVGFGGRALNHANNSPTRPKYINSSASDIYDKSATLFGLYESMPLIEKGRPVVLVEGFFDVLAVMSLGYPAVAPCGTALTQKHVELLSKYTANVILSFDGDEAGQQAAEKSMPLLLDKDFHIKLVDFKGVDPADLWVSDRKKLFDLISSAPDILESAIAKLAGSQNEHIYARLGKIDGVFEKISHIGRPLIRNNYFRHLAKVLGENLRDIQIEFDKYCQLKRKNIQKSGDQNQPQVLSGKSGGENKKIEISDLLLLRVFLNFPVLLYENQEILTHLPHPDIQSIAEQVLRAFGDNKNIEVVELIRQMKLPRNSRFLPFLMRLLQEDEHIEQKDAQTAISEYLKSKDQEKHSVEFRSIKQQIRDAEKVGDIHGIRVFLQKQSQKLHENRKLNSLEGLE